MDTQQPKWTPEEEARIAAGLDLIKRAMPMTYQAVQDKAQGIGNRAYGYVRRGLAGRANSFYAVEGGHVVGQPFSLPADMADRVGSLIAQFGCSFLILWAPEAQQGGNDGSH